MNTKQMTGNAGEREATKYLSNLGYEILCNNFRCIQGEIDIIAKDQKELVFIEVKTRRSTRYGEAREAVDEKKQKHINKNNLENENVRIDVIEVYIQKRLRIIKHIKEAIK